MNKLQNKGCLYKIIPQGYYYQDNKERHNLLIIDKLYINIKNQKAYLMIVKGLFKKQFYCYNNTVIILTLFIAAANLVFASLLSFNIENSVIIVSDIVTGVLGIVVAYFAKSRDQKDELTHELLTVLNDCNIFLSDCEKYVTKTILKLEDNPEDGDDVTIRKLHDNYPEILKRCDDIINTFTTEEAIVLTNGPIYRCCIPFFDPYSLKKMLNVEERMKIDEDIICEIQEIQPNNVNLEITNGFNIDLIEPSNNVVELIVQDTNVNEEQFENIELGITTT